MMSLFRCFSWNRTLCSKAEAGINFHTGNVAIVLRNSLIWGMSLQHLGNRMHIVLVILTTVCRQ